MNILKKQIYLGFMPSKYGICSFFNKSAGATILLKSWHFLLCFPSHYLIFPHFLLGIFSLLFTSLLFLFLFVFLHCLSFFCFLFESVFSTFSVAVKFLILHSPFSSCLYSLSLHSHDFFSFSFFKLVSFSFFYSCHLLHLHTLHFPTLSLCIFCMESQ